MSAETVAEVVGVAEGRAGATRGAAVVVMIETGEVSAAGGHVRLLASAIEGIVADGEDPGAAA